MCEQKSQLAYLTHQISERLARLDSSAKWYRNRHYRWQLMSVFLSGVITIVAGLKSLPLDTAITSDILLVLGATSTVWTAIGAFFSPKDSWQLTADVYGKLRALDARIQFAEQSPTFNEHEGDFVACSFDEYQNILKDFNSRWQNLRNTAK